MLRLKPSGSGRLIAVIVAASFAVPAYADEPPSAITDEPAPKSDAPPANTAPAADAAPAPTPKAPEPPPTAQPVVTTVPVTKTDEAGDEEVIPNPPKLYGIAFGAAAVGCLVLGGILGGVALSRASDLDGNPSAPPIYTHAQEDTAKEGSHLATSAYVFIGLGTALAVTDIVLWIETFRKPRVIKRTASASPPRRAALQFTGQGVRF